MDVDRARTFLEIVHTGSFLKASDRLHVTQTTVSARIRTLEEELGRQLARGGNAQYRSMTELVDALAQAGVTLEPAALQDLKVSSRYFVARADVELGGRHYRFYSLLQRDGGGGRVLQRMQSGYE